MSRAACNGCLFAGLEPVTLADTYRSNGRYARTCALHRAPPATHQACPSRVQEPDEEMAFGPWNRAVADARRAASR